MHYGKLVRISLLVFLFTQAMSGPSYARQTRKLQRILIATPKPYDRVIRAIEARGGKVTHEYKYVDGIAAELPDEALESIRALVGTAAISKDADVQLPNTINPIRSRTAAAGNGAAVVTAPSARQVNLSTSDVGTLAMDNPEIYSLNNAGTRIEQLHSMALTGEGVTVAVIDSGVRNGFKFVMDSVVGGIDFVDDGAPGPGGDSNMDWKKASNDGHGTFAAGLIAGNKSFAVDGVLDDALELYAPGAVVDGNLPLVGTAPDSKIYVVRVFGENAAAGTTVGTIIAAIQHVIDQRDLYDHTGGQQGVKISVANLSLGVSTLAAGRTFLDQSVDAMLQAGIVPVVSVGNTGPSALTNSSPGSSMSALTVGGSSRAANERILNEVLYGTDIPEEYYLGIGGDIRPFSGTETAWFSSRGPNADGRLDPDVVASGVGNIGQGYCPDQILDACFDNLSIASGTSFSAPIVSGIAAVLAQAFPGASATQIRNAIIASGQTSKIKSYFDIVDRGNGLPDAFAAYELLASGMVDDTLPTVSTPHELVKRNIEDNTNLDVLSGFVSKSMTGLKPGQRGEILYEVRPRAERVIVTISDVVMSGPQNTFYEGDGLFLYVHSAKTSSIGAAGDYKVPGVLLEDGDETVEVLENPDTGIMRITLNPDTLNAGRVAATVTVDTIFEAWPNSTFAASISDGQTRQYTLPVEAGLARLDFLLTWDHDWAHYPTSDVDLIVCSPNIPSTILECNAQGNKKGATLAGPERVSISDPAPGDWTLLVKGFNVPLGPDNFKLRVTKVAN
jgi:hypothetical protein